MNRDKLSIKRKLDWIRIAFILQELGELSLDELNYSMSEMFKKGAKTNREISAIVSSYESKGFHVSRRSRTVIFSFRGEIPDIHPKTIKRWEKKIKPLKGFDQN